MATSKNDIREWLSRAKPTDTHMLVVCDCWDYEDFPVFVRAEDDIDAMISKYSTNMCRVMEVYNLKMDAESQLDEFRAWHI